MKNCVYRIINVINNKVYIGSTIDPERRRIEHFSQLENNIHINPHLQNAYNKYGKDAFVFDIIESNLSNDELLKREQHYIDLFNASNSNFGYNISSYANQPDGRKYVKLYTVKLREVIKQNKVSGGAIALFTCLQIYIEKYTNRVALSNGENITNQAMIELTGFSRQHISTLLNELQDNNLIKRIGTGRNRKIYVNPYIVTAGVEVQQEVYDMFNRHE